MTLKQLQQDLAEWLKDPAKAKDMGKKIDDLLGLLRNAADGVRNNLANDELTPEFAQLLRSTEGAYAEIEQCLNALNDCVRGNDREAVQEERIYLRAAGASLRQHTDAIQHWLETPEFRCPRCGGTEEELELCPDCGLELVLRDPNPSPHASRQFLQLPLEFVDVFKTYQAILSGDLPLRELGQPLQTLRAHLQGYLKARSRDKQYKEHVEELRHLANEALMGVERMERAWDSREIADLNVGWLQIFEAGGELQKQLAPLLHELGRGESAESDGFGMDTFEFSPRRPEQR